MSADFAASPPLCEAPGPAPAGVCSRWMGESPCGAAAVGHVIWSPDMANGAVCGAHEREARERWTWIGLHPYTAACAASGRQDSIWLPEEDRCVIDGTGDQPPRQQQESPVARP